ncbi:MAG: DUF1292 domain-containing protein [Clostridia bacterium]|nr:DUF1292 domain-containing protein [Clostridia bacterium]
MIYEEEKDGCASGCSSCAGCGHDHGHEEEFDPIITLTDEEGKDMQFEILDVVALDDSKQFLVVAEVGQSENKDVEVTILEIKEEDGEEVYDTVTDKDLAEKVFKKFEEQQDDLYEDEE